MNDKIRNIVALFLFFSICLGFILRDKKEENKVDISVISEKVNDSKNTSIKNSEKDLRFFIDFIDEEKKDSLQILEEDDTKHSVKYLGNIVLENNKLYYVLTNFSVIGINGMISPRGKSELIFINKDKTEIIKYYAGMPDELPNKINKNSLIFSYNNSEIKLFELLIDNDFPPVLCPKYIGCFERIY